MAVLNRYRVRAQFFRDIVLDAKNVQDASTLAEQDAQLDSDADIVNVQGTTMIAENTGDNGNGVTLNRYRVRTRIRRNVVLDAENRSAARSLAREDVELTNDVDSVQAQQTTLLEENTGSTD